MGWPVAHSLSPRLHGYWLGRYGIDGAYVPLAVDPAAFDAAVRGLAPLGFRGANVTVPHKEAAFAAMDSLSETAKRLRAVNTIVVADGRLHGDNTDGFGFLENLSAGAPGLDIRGRAVTVLGAGGAARAVVAALTDAGAEKVRIVNRTAARTDALAADLGGPIAAFGWRDTAAALGGAALVVNTTSLGMAGQPPLELDLDHLPADAVVTDIVYSPLETPLLAAARARGNAVVDGLGMLLHQARPGFEAWFGRAPEVTPELRAHVLAEIGS